MTTAQLEYPARSHELRGRYRGESPAMRASRSRRTGMISEAVVARYIRDLSAHGRHIRRATERPQVATR